MRTLRVRFAVMLATAAVVPLLTYGAVSLYSLNVGTRRTVVESHLNVARQVAQQVRRYISTNLQILQALAADLENTSLTPQQTDRILKNYVLRFPEFRELTVVDGSGNAVATSRLGLPAVLKAAEFTQLTADWTPRSGQAAGRIIDRVRMSHVFVDGDMLPTTLVVAPIAASGQQGAGWLVGEFSIEELWRMVGRISFGAQGYALVLGPGGELLAHGNPDERSRVATDAVVRTQGGRIQGSDPTINAIIDALHGQSTDAPVVREDERLVGGRMLAVGIDIPDLGWTVVVSQPTREAYAIADQLQNQLVGAISLALLIMILVGWVWGRSLIRPITALITGTQAIASGRLDERVAIESKSELGTLGAAFNGMADRLVELQADVRRQERHAMFGRVAAGLVHDLSHPFKNVQNNCRLILKMHDDPEYREMFRRTVDREFGTIRRVFEDLRNIARPMPLERFPLDLNTLVADIGESMRANAATAGVALSVELGRARLFMLGDMFALGRVCRNLVLNAIEATPPRGRIVMDAAAIGGKVRIRVSDTGCGIAPDRIATVFEDFTTTKRQGLGLGLAIVKKIVEQLGGNVSVTSEVGRGTTFVLEFGQIPPPETAG
ncbi:MAG: sensor histidine kinase [Acidobacteria bacterium]|nr:sensor histidine kinase [Acidobacteriota bacterium]